jgi:hypothetical protein
VVCVLLAVASLVVPSVPTYDPMAWLLWGREISSGELHTTGGPSWKPLPVLVTAVLAAAGDRAPELWLVVARAGLLGSVALGFVLARRLAGLLAGCLAAGILLLAPWMLASGLRGYSEGIAVLFVLAAIERHDRGRVAQAFWLGVVAALLRPEGAALVGVYGLWLAWRDARRGPWVVAGALLIAVLWTLPELWGSGNLWRAAERAQDVRSGSAALADRPAYEIAKLALKLVTPPGALVALMAVSLAASGAVATRTRPLVAQLAGVSVAWTALVAAMTERGFAGNWRYLVIPAALTLVLAAVAVGWLWSVILPRFGASARLLRPATLGLSAAVVATYVLLSVPPTLRTYAFEVEVNEEIEVVVARLGGAERLRQCGPIYVNPFLVQTPCLGTSPAVHDHRRRPPRTARRPRRGPAHAADRRPPAAPARNLAPPRRAGSPAAHRQMGGRTTLRPALTPCNTNRHRRSGPTREPVLAPEAIYAVLLCRAGAGSSMPRAVGGRELRRRVATIAHARGPLIGVPLVPPSSSARPPCDGAVALLPPRRGTCVADTAQKHWPSALRVRLGPPTNGSSFSLHWRSWRTMLARTVFGP